MKELIEKLRKVGTLCGDYHQFSTAKTITQEAADAIEKLQAELERTRKERDCAVVDIESLIKDHRQVCKYCCRQYAECREGCYPKWRGVRGGQPMNDLISRKALLEEVKNEQETLVFPTDYEKGYNNGLSMAFAIALKAPAVESKPKQGWWINPYMNRYGHPCHCCSVCGFKAS